MLGLFMVCGVVDDYSVDGRSGGFEDRGPLRPEGDDWRGWGVSCEDWGAGRAFRMRVAVVSKQEGDGDKDAYG